MVDAPNTQLIKIGESFGFTVPQSVVEHLKVAEGDELQLVLEQDGSVHVISLSAQDRTEKIITLANQLMDRYPNALQALRD